MIFHWKETPCVSLYVHADTGLVMDKIEITACSSFTLFRVDSTGFEYITLDFAKAAVEKEFKGGKQWFASKH